MMMEDEMREKRGESSKKEVRSNGLRENISSERAKGSCTAGANKMEATGSIIKSSERERERERERRDGESTGE